MILQWDLLGHVNCLVYFYGMVHLTDLNETK